MAPPPRTPTERIWQLESDIRTMKEDLIPLLKLPVEHAVMKRDIDSLKTLMAWLIGVLATFAIALLIAAVTFAINTLGAT